MEIHSNNTPNPEAYKSSLLYNVTNTTLPLLSPKHRLPKRSDYLSHYEAMNQINGFLFANSIGVKFYSHVTIHLGMSPEFPVLSPRDQQAFIGNILKGCQHWLRYNGVKNLSYLWAKENADKKRLHLHLLLNLPRRLRSRFKAFVLKSGNFSRDRIGMEGEAVRITGGTPGKRDKGAVTEGQRVWIFLYQLKGIKPTNPSPGTNEGVFEPLGIWTEQGHPIWGKRMGMSQNLNRAARAKAGWRELTDWQSLDAALSSFRRSLDGKLAGLATP